MKEKSEHDFLMKLLQKHFDEDEIEEAMRDLRDDEDRDDDYYDDLQDDLDDERKDLPEYDMMDDEDEEVEEEEDMELPKDKRKGLAVVIIQKRMSKPKKDL